MVRTPTAVTAPGTRSASTRTPSGSSRRFTLAAISVASSPPLPAASRAAAKIQSSVSRLMANARRKVSAPAAARTAVTARVADQSCEGSSSPSLGTVITWTGCAGLGSFLEMTAALRKAGAAMSRSTSTDVTVSNNAPVRDADQADHSARTRYVRLSSDEFILLSGHFGQQACLGERVDLPAQEDQKRQREQGHRQQRTHQSQRRSGAKNLGPSYREAVADACAVESWPHNRGSHCQRRCSEDQIQEDAAV